MLLCIAACNRGKDKVKKAAPAPAISLSKKLTGEDSLQVVHDIDSADYVSIFKNKTNTWIGKAVNNPQSKWSDFHLIDYWQKTDFPPHPDTLSKPFLTDYAMFLKWSPDSAYMLDIGSYGVTMAQDKQGKLYPQSGDVDTQVSLYDNNKKTSERMLFFGPSSYSMDAHWADSSKVAVMALYDPDGSHSPDTILWLIDVKEKFFSKYIYHK